MALDWQRLEYAFTRGLNQKADQRSGIAAPELVRAVNVDFDNLGGLRLRKPFSTIGANILGGGTISGCRRVYACGDELILFTSSALYSWSPNQSVWVSRATHLAVKVDENPVFVTTGDQIQADRAELDDTIAYAWTDDGSVYLAAVDKTTGAVLLSPTAVANATRPRLVALTTKILMFVLTTDPELQVYTIDPAAPALGSAATVSTAVGATTPYDVVKKPGADTAVYATQLDTTTSYEVGTVTAAGVMVSASPARVCDGAIAVSIAGDATIQVIRGDGTNVEGDKLSAALADVTINQAIGTITAGEVSFVTACHRTDTRCYVFWVDEVTSSERNVKYNHVNPAGTIGTEDVFLRQAEIVSRAFTYDASVFVHLHFDGSSLFFGSTGFESIVTPLQNTTFLYRDDITVHAKISPGKAANCQDTVGYLPGVALTSGTAVFSWCGLERRRIPIGTVIGSASYSDRGPRDVSITFDSNDARRVAKLGQTVYVACGEGVMQYDGANFVEVGFHTVPWEGTGGENAAGSIAVNSTWAVRFSYRWDNAKGERDRSTTGMVGEVAIAAQPGSIDISALRPLYVTKKTNRPVAVEVWRTAAAPTDAAPFYLATNTDPTDTSGANCFIANSTSVATLSTWNDDFTDAILTTKETNPENNGVLENLAPPAAKFIVANDTRLFLAGVAGDPHRVWYSKQRNDGEVAAFHDALVVPVPEVGGAITGLAFLNETLVVFRETAIYALDGSGYDNTGGGQNYQARLVSSDVGAAVQESIALTPNGLMFMSSKGWYLLNRGWSTSYIGGPVRDLDDPDVFAVTVVEAQHQVRILTSSDNMVVFDYLANTWFEWTVTNTLHACMWNGLHHVMETAAVIAEQSDWTLASYAMDVEMLIHLGGLQGFARCRRILALGEYRSTHTLRFRIGDYAEDTYWDDKTWTVSPTTVGGELEVQHGPSRQQNKVLRVRLTTSTTAGEKLKLSALSLEVGFKPGVFPHLPAAQRQ